MKQIFFALLLMLSGTFLFAKSNSKHNIPEVIDYQGQAMGNEIPAWVKAVTSGERNKVYKSLGVEKNRAIFILQNKGNDLDFLKTWTDQVDVRGEVANSIEQQVGQIVQAEMAISQFSEEEKAREAKIYSAAMSNITLNGLMKEAQYWIKTRVLKTGLKKAKSNDDYIVEYTYYVVYSIDKNVYMAQFESALKDVDNNTSESSNLKSSITKAISDKTVMAKNEALSFKNVPVEEVEE